MGPSHGKSDNQPGNFFHAHLPSPDPGLLSPQFAGPGSHRASAPPVLTLVPPQWFASQEARRRGSDPQHRSAPPLPTTRNLSTLSGTHAAPPLPSVDFAARRMSSLSDVVASANAVNKEP
eukprot:1102315-Rhodomonas_salina.2